MTDESEDDASEELATRLDHETRQLSALLAKDHLEPDPSRTAWSRHAAELDAIWTQSHERIRAALDEIADADLDPIELGTLRTRCADALGEAAALLRAASRIEQSATVLALAATTARGLLPGPELDEAVARPDRWLALAHARWLAAHGDSRRARAIAGELARSRSGAIAAAASRFASANRWKYVAIAGSIVFVGAMGWHEYSKYDRVHTQIEEAEALAAEDPDAAIDRYLQIVDDEETSEHTKKEAAEAVFDLLVAAVPTPVTPQDVPAIENFAARLRTLHPAARTPEMIASGVQRLEDWATELGSADQEAVLAQLDVLALTDPIADHGATARIRVRREQLVRTLAEELAAEWPIEAIRQYGELGASPPDARAAGALFDALGEGPAIWIEAAHELEAWAHHAELDPELAEIRARALDRLAKAQQHVARSDRAELLTAADANALAAYLLEHPGDQEVAVALADGHLAAGQPAKAIAVLEALGDPGHRILAAQLATAAAYLEGDRAAEASLLLERVLSSRFPAYRGARRALGTRIEIVESRLIEQADAGDIPEPWASRLERASDQRAQEIFGEWLSEAIAADAEIASLRDRNGELAEIVAVATQLGSVKLTLAENAEGEEREALLAAAERAFLSIEDEGRGAPSYHLGLGRVYFRLGREQEGEREFAEVLGVGDPELNLSVAHQYRDLGKEARARDVAESVYESSSGAIQYAAAHLMALLASDEDEQELWLGRCDPADEAARLNLREARARKLIDEGQLEEADALLASIAEAWTARDDADPSSANNAALAQLARFQCSGDPQRLRDAVALVEKAQRLAPGVAIVASNFADVREAQALVEVLDARMDTRALRPTSSEAATVLDAMLEGTEADAIRRALRASRSVRRVLDAHTQTRVLAPTSPDAFADLEWAARLRDEQRFVALGKKLAAAEVDLEQARREWAEVQAGEHDERAMEVATARIDDYRARRDVAAGQRSASTVAATWLLEADALIHLATVSRDPGHARSAVEAMESAQATWPAIGGNETLAGAWFLHAALEVRANDSTLRETIDGASHYLGWALPLAALDDPALAEALVAHASFTRAMELRRALDDEALSPLEWMLAKLSGDTALMDRALARVRTPTGRVQLDALERLNPTDLGARVRAALPPLD